MLQKWPFFQLFFLLNIGQENVFYDILARKYRLSRPWKQELQKVEKLTFFHCFGLKMLIFQPFFLGYIVLENVFYDILERKNAFLGYKNKKFKKSKSCHFCKGVNPFCLDKNGHFCSFFFFRQNRPGNCLLRYSTTKKRLSWL